MTEDLGGDRPDVSAILERAASAYRTATENRPKPWRVGVDLGTATCVLVVLGGDGMPVWVDTEGSGALRDGVVVDFARAVAAIRTLKKRAEEVLGGTLTNSATAYPPCVGESESRACRYVVENAGFESVTLVDEVSAAQATLGVSEGVVVDVGGGSTGVGVFHGGRLTALDDRPGGGHHLDLVLAGALGIDVKAAERIKREDPEKAVSFLKPGVERIAESVRAMTVGDESLELHLAGGALMLPRSGEVIAKYLGRPVREYDHALLITPVGIARSAA